MRDRLTYTLRYGSAVLDSKDGAFCHLSDDLSVGYEKSNEGAIFDKKLGGSIVLFDKAFDMVYAEYKKADSGNFYFALNFDSKSVFNGKFTVKDCELDFDNRSFTATMTDADSKSAELKTFTNKEFNILAIGAGCTKTGIRYYDTTQVTMAGSGTSLLICNGQVWSTDISKSTDSVLIDTRYNGFEKRQFNDAVYSLSYAQYSRGDYYQQSDDVIVSRSNSNYMVRFNNSSVWTGSAWRTTITANYIIMAYGGGASSQHTKTMTYTAASKTTWKDNLSDFYLTLINSSNNIYVRTLTRVAKYTDSKIKTDSDCDNKTRFNYHRPGGMSVAAVTSTRLTNEVSGYGINNDGKYYLPPDDINTYYPLCQDIWTDSISFWLKKSSAMGLTTYEDISVHSYDIKSIIGKLLQKIGMTLELRDRDTAFSYGGTFRVIPNSNIKAFPYSQPASVLKTTLKKLLITCCNVFNMDYYIDGSKLVLCSKKQTNYTIYQDGGMKPSADECQLDITTLYDSSSKKLVGSGQNTVKFDTDYKLYYNFAYNTSADDNGDFSNAQLECVDVMAADGSTETVDFGCDADINRMLLSPNEFSDTDYLLVHEKDGYVVCRTTPDNSVKVQNGSMAISRVAYYYQYLMPNKNYVMRDRAYTAKASKMFHEVSCKVPLSTPNLDMLKGIFTQFGACQIEKCSINLTTFVADVNLRF